MQPLTLGHGSLTIFLSCTENSGTSQCIDANISLMFVLQARVSEVEISEVLESFIAPALLPRTFINLQVRCD